jgi:predicted lipoprotein with Yx(FWY)xxD motif
MARTVRWSFRVSLAMLGAVLFAVGALPIPASAAGAASAVPTVKVAQDPKYGTILTDAQGMTLYMFKKDKSGESMCSGTCVKNWPPLTVAEGMQPAAAPGITGKLGEIERKDDTYQVTYNGMPLYRYARDAKAGDVNGQGLGGLWFVVPTGSSPSAASAGGTSAKGW